MKKVCCTKKRTKSKEKEKAEQEKVAADKQEQAAE